MGAAASNHCETLGHAFDSGKNNFNLIRLVAALAVIYGHSYYLTGTPGGDLFLTLVGFKFIGGVAVDIFFVISGFLIAASLSRSGVRRYLASRCLRILPALVVAVLLCVLVLGPILTTDPGYWRNPQTWRYVVNNAFLLKTEYRLPGVFSGHRDAGVNGSLWSLPVEFRLYLALLVVSLVGWLTPKRFSAFALLLIALVLYLTPRFSWFQTYVNWVDAGAFFLGGTYLWVYRYEVPLSHWAVVGFLSLALMTHGTGSFYVAYYLCVTYLVFYVGFVVRLPVIKKNDISYGVYLYGWPVQQCVIFAAPGHGAAFNTVVASSITLGIAYASWRLVEQPMLKMKAKLV